MTQYPLCELFQSTPKEINTRHVFFDITAEDDAPLIQFQHVIRD